MNATFKRTYVLYSIAMLVWNVLCSWYLKKKHHVVMKDKFQLGYYIFLARNLRNLISKQGNWKILIFWRQSRGKLGNLISEKGNWKILIFWRQSRRKLKNLISEKGNWNILIFWQRQLREGNWFLEGEAIKLRKIKAIKM